MNTTLHDDWLEIHRRIDAASEAFAHGYALSPEQERLILKERAHALSQPIENTEEAGGMLEVVEFELASECYAFPLRQVREVCRLRELTPVPCTPAFILGIINLRGEILTIIDLKPGFELPASSTSDLSKIFILHGDGMQLGVLADAIGGVRKLQPGELQPALPTLTGHRAEYLHGITHDRVVVLDAAKLLADPRLLVNEDIPS